jgi:xylulokinase
MSLIGIDVGSSSVKIAAYGVDGTLLAIVSNELTPIHSQPGWWEQDPQDVWRATANGLRALMGKDCVQHDPPEALAISASGRENFPADATGNPLGNNIMGADLRGTEFETPPAGSAVPEPWTYSCGHLRERMDPVFRLMWWRKYHPEVTAKTRLYPDWHGFLTLRLCGRNVSERSLVGRWLVYDVRSKTWDAGRLQEYEIGAELLPELLPAGAVIDTIKPQLADELGLPRKLKIITGGHDLNCAGLGAGVSELGTVLLISGSYENMLIPTIVYPTASMLLRGLSITPHFGKIERSVYAICPTGNAVLNWARSLVGLPLDEQAGLIETEDQSPSPVLALPYLSGAMLYWKGGRRLRGVLVGLTLATKPLDILKAFMESIAYDHVNTLSLLHEEGVEVKKIRATGGGTRSTWWTQLKADMMSAPIEVVVQPEPGTFGAALLAGHGIGVFPDLEEASKAFAGTGKTYTPNPARASLHEEKLASYRVLVPTLLSTVFKD